MRENFEKLLPELLFFPPCSNLIMPPSEPDIYFRGFSESEMFNFSDLLIESEAE